MNKRIQWLLLVVTLFAVGCSKQEIPVEQMVGKSPVFYAEFADAQTKTYFDEDLNLFWHSKDRLTIFNGTTLNRQFEFDGPDGATSGGFNDLTTGFVTGAPSSTNYAVYPYNSSTVLSKNADPELDELLTVTLPAEQQYAVNTFGKGANTMVAVTKDKNDTFLAFKNVGGYLKLKLYGEGERVRSISFKGNAKEKLAGQATVTATYGSTPQVKMGNEAIEEIILDCGEEGVALGNTSNDATVFWLVIPPTKFEGGFTITVTDVNGLEMVKSTNATFVVERNVVKSMAAIKFESNVQKDNVIIYRTESCNAIDISGDEFDVAIASHSYENGVGKILFEAPLTSISENAFNNTDITQITLPNSVNSIGELAFAGCVNLKKISLPSSVATIEKSLFSGCRELEEVIIPNGVETIESSAFVGCGLNYISIPQSVKTIAKCAFQANNNLMEVTIPNGVEEIGEFAFHGCTNLEKVTIPASVKLIGSDAFYDCI